MIRRTRVRRRTSRVLDPARRLLAALVRASTVISGEVTTDQPYVRKVIAVRSSEAPMPRRASAHRAADGVLGAACLSCSGALKSSCR